MRRDSAYKRRGGRLWEIGKAVVAKYMSYLNIWHKILSYSTEPQKGVYQGPESQHEAPKHNSRGTTIWNKVQFWTEGTTRVLRMQNPCRRQQSCLGVLIQTTEERSEGSTHSLFWTAQWMVNFKLTVNLSVRGIAPGTHWKWILSGHGGIYRSYCEISSGR